MNGEIHSDLKWPGRVMKLLFRANLSLFRLLHWLGNRSKSKAIEGYTNETHWVSRRLNTGKSKQVKIRVQVYGPLQKKEPLPVLLYLHGGGYALGSPEESHPAIKNFLSACPCIVVAPSYTKSIESPYPAAIDDCEDTLDWVLENSERLNIRTDKLIVGGHSAGGGLTLALMLRVRARGDVSVIFQMPIYPMIDHRSTTESARDNCMPVWNTSHNKLAWKLYLDDLSHRETVPEDAAPTQAQDYCGLPPTMTYVGSLDPFLDETVNFVEQCKQDGVNIEFDVFEGCYHGFDLLVPNAPPSKQAIHFMQAKFAAAVERYTEPQP